LDSLLSHEARIDFLKLDIQGFEFRALSAAPETLRKTNVVHTEALFAPMYLQQGYFADIDILLREAGFEFVDLFEIKRYRYSDPASAVPERMIWADAVYFRQLDPAEDAQADFLAQAIVADAVYQKSFFAKALLKLGSVAG
jgi:hypothetical protein